jgi:NH3-dependent NAD+ synthetase
MGMLERADWFDGLAQKVIGVRLSYQNNSKNIQEFCELLVTSHENEDIRAVAQDILTQLEYMTEDDLIFNN